MSKRRMLRRGTRLGLLVVALGTVGSLGVLAPVARSQAAPGQAGAPVPSRVTQRVDEANRITLRGGTHPLARPQFDRGKVEPSLKLDRITIVFQPTAAQQADLDALLAAQQNPTSPSFHQWLSSEQYADRFGIAPSDLAQVSAWLQAQGFDIVETPASRTLIVFGGTAAQVESAFRTEIHRYAANGKAFYANSAEPSLPAALAGVVLGFRGLNNYPVKARVLQKGVVSPLQPDFTSSISGNHFIAPDDFATIYDLKPLYGRTPAIDGTGQKIAIVGQSNIVLADIAAFRAASGLPANVPVLTLVPGSSDPGVLNSTGDERESSIDIEWAGAVATNATILFVYANPNTTNGVFDALQYAVAQNLAPVITSSYGICEPALAPSDVDFFVGLAQQANAKGITIVSSVGDGGATDCDGGTGDYPATLGLNVDVPGSLPYVTGVGGTEFTEGNGAYWNATNNVSNGSALFYIPEMVWNDSSSSNGLSATGGGASSIFAKPSWQTGTGVPVDGFRDVPDIAINASPSHDGYLACLQFIPQGQTAYTSSCVNGFRYSDNSLQIFGGTSFGAPTFGGILALVNQATNAAGQGNANYILYPLAASQPTAFHDVTTGNNASACVSGTLNCPSGGPIGFSAGTGYDQATGLGTIDATNLVTAWHLISASGGSTPTLSSISPTSISAGSASFTLTATGSNFATNAQILWNGSTLGVTMQPGGTATSIKATISNTLVAFGTAAEITVTDDAAKAGESSAPQTFIVNGTPPANDNIANAIAVTTSGFTSTVDNSAATTESTDPTPGCANGSTNPRTKTVWWSLTPAASGVFAANTIGSVYDTTLSVWTGAPGSLAQVACNDDVPNSPLTQSQLSFSATAGTKYYFMVAPFGAPDTGTDLLGGKTVLNVSNASPISLSASPSSRSVAAGSSATYTITDAASVSYALSCTGLPAGAACGSLTVPANSTGSLVISTTSRTSNAPPFAPRKPLHFDPWAEVLGGLGILALVALAMRGPRARAWAPAGALAVLLLLLAAGCGGGAGSASTTTNPNGTPAGTYAITVTGTASGSATQSTTITLIVS